MPDLCQATGKLGGTWDDVPYIWIEGTLSKISCRVDQRPRCPLFYKDIGRAKSSRVEELGAFGRTSAG